MGSEPLSRPSKERVERVAEGLLLNAGVLGELPTPMDAVREAAGIREMLDISELPEGLAAKKPPKWRRILGALWFSERVTFIDRREPAARVAFTDAHEAIHASCPWHEPILRLDNEETLEGRVQEIVETEANYGAAHVIFQGARFFQRALREQVSLRTPLAFAGEYGASRHAAIHYYAEGHPDPVALIVTGRFPWTDGGLPIWRTVESESFELRFGRLTSLFPTGRLSLVDGSLFGDICLASRESLDPPSKKIDLLDRDGRSHRFVAEAFFNQHCHLVLVTENRARLLGRRARLVGANAVMGR